jgi:calcium-dependent protein kinase
MEYCEDGDLFDHLLSCEKYNEEETAKIIKQILSAIRYLHDKNIVHRDLKLENILFENKNAKDLNIKLIDFGLSQLLGINIKEINTK